MSIGSVSAGNHSCLLEVENLEIVFDTKSGRLPVVEDIGFRLDRNETLGIVGESGSGKSVTARSIIRLLPTKNCAIRGGSIRFKGQDITRLSEAAINRIRGNEIAMIFQDPMTSLNPTVRIKTQIMEGLRVEGKMSRKEALACTLELMRKVGIPDGERRIMDYPFQLSGGMQQRVMIASAISRNPSLLIADEPTTALDVSIQGQILNLLIQLKSAYEMGLIMITHDMGVITKMCDRVLVMYAGHVMEIAEIEDLFYRPRHPYTASLLRSIPQMNQANRKKLMSIEGSPPELEDFPKGCRFHPRCFNRRGICSRERPTKTAADGNHIYYCWNPVE